jgi:CDP-paratose 2-epimerase
MSLDNTTHSLFGASKLSADILVQEYGRYFNLKTVCFRGGCLTGPMHMGAEQHGFLAYLVKCIAEQNQYTIYGHKGKQVRDNIHVFDLVTAFYEYTKEPKIAEIYNIGGGKHSNISILEAVDLIEKKLKKKAILKCLDVPRKGDHIWYISDVRKFKRHYPEWNYKYDIGMIIDEICEVYEKK